MIETYEVSKNGSDIAFFFNFMSLLEYKYWEREQRTTHFKCFNADRFTPKWL